MGNKFIRIGSSMILTLLVVISLGAQTPPDLSFSEYNYAEMFRQIYVGRLEAVRREMKLGSGMNTAQRKQWLALAYMVYHGVYEKQCLAQSSEPKATFTDPGYVSTTMRWGVEVARHERPTINIALRERFYTAFAQAYGQSKLALIIPEDKKNPAGNFAVMAELDQDLNRFLKEHACGASQVVRFEENLHRAFTGEPAVQDELPYPQGAPRFAKGCAATLPTIRKGAEKDCGCVYAAMKKKLRPEHLWELEDGFTEERFLLTTALAPGLHAEVSKCFR